MSGVKEEKLFFHPLFVVQSLSHVLTPCDPMDCSTPGFCVLHCLLELAQTHVHWVGDGHWVGNVWCHPNISSTVVPFSSCLQSFPASGSFPMSQLFAAGGQSVGASTSASVFPMNTQGSFLLDRLVWSPWYPKDSRVFSSTTIQKHQFFGTKPSYGLTHASRHDNWKIHSFNSRDLCQQSDVSVL